MSTQSTLWALAAICVGGCTGDIDGPGNEEPGAVAVSFDIAALVDGGINVDLVTITLEHRGSRDIKVVIVAPEGTTATTDPLDLAVGQWDIQAELFSGGTLVASGSGTALVLPGFVTQVDIDIVLATGGVEVTVGWDENIGGVIADISTRPILVEISSIGTFLAHGLSRIGWDIEVIETPWAGPGTQLVTRKESGDVSFPDIAMLNLTSSLSEAEALADWMNGPPSPRTVEFIGVQGPRGELARIAVFDVVAVGGDPGIVEVDDAFTVAGVRLGDISDIQLTDYQSPLNSRCPLPGNTVEVSFPGFPSNEACFPLGVLDIPEHNSSDPLYLPGALDGVDFYDWAFEIRDQAETFGCVCQTDSRADLSVIWSHGDGAEIQRINLFGAWPSSFTLFNPEVEYDLSNHLFDINIVLELAGIG